jgi:voltage-gated potassium channel
MHKLSKYSLPIFILSYILIIYFIVFFEKQHENSNIKTLTDGFWFSIVTLTTVGYGDFYPISLAGRILSLILIISSVGLLGIFISRLSSFFYTYYQKRKQGYFGTNMENHFIIIGWNNFSKQVADQIVNANCKIAVVTNNKNDLELIRDLYSEQEAFCLFCDYDNFDALEKININKANSVFVNFGEDSKSLVYIINLKKHYNVEVVVSLETAELKETFMSVGVKYVVSKNQISSKLVASYIFEPDVAMLTEDLMTTSTDKNEYDMQEYKVLGNSEFENSKYIDSFVNLKKKYNTVLIGVSRVVENQRIVIKNPDLEFIIKTNDYLILISNNEQKSDLRKAFAIKEGRQNG